MKSIFLKLSSFRFGAARRHCPFTSIIHKLISFLFAVIFFSMHCFLVPAAATQIQPQFNPIIGSSAYQVQNFVNGLTPDQLQIFYLLSGTQAITYTGFGNQVVSEDLSTVDKVTNWLKEFGQSFYADLFLGSVGLSSDLAAPLYDALLGTAQYSSKQVDDFNTWFNSVNSSSDPFLVPFDNDLVTSYNQFFALNNGLYQWQLSTFPFTCSREYISVYMSDNILNTYWSELSDYPTPYVRGNVSNTNDSTSSGSFRMADDTFFNTYTNIFVNTSTHQITLADNNGTLLTTANHSIDVGVYVRNDSLTTTSYNWNFRVPWTYDVNDYPTD